MKYKEIKGNEIDGDLDIFIANKEVLIHGNPEGLKSFAKLLIELAELNQENIDNKFLPVGAREHYHLTSNIELSKSSVDVVVGRIDAKGTKEYYQRYIQKDN